MFNVQVPDYNAHIKEMQENIRKTKEYDNGFANIFYEQLVESINKFDKELDPDKEVGMRLVTYGNTIQFHIEDIGYKNPYLIFFYGHLEDGSPIELVQHVSQISFVLIALKREKPVEPKRLIGFRKQT